MHKFCSYERGSNENNNKLIRRFIEKGVDIGKFSKKRIKEIEKFMNDYPRKMFGGLSSNEVYKSLEKNYKILTLRVAIYKDEILLINYLTFTDSGRKKQQKNLEKNIKKCKYSYDSRREW